MSVATPISPVQRVGKLQTFQFFVTGQDVGGGFQAIAQVASGSSASIRIDSPANAFYIVDAPCPIYCSTDISTPGFYGMQTGESFNQAMGHVFLKGVPKNFDYADTTGQFSITLWTGTDTHVGYIDHRAISNWCDVETAYAFATTAGNQAIAAGLTAQINVAGFPTSGQTFNPFGANNFRVAGFVVSNMDTTQQIFVTDNFGAYLGMVPPNQTVRFSPSFMGRNATGPTETGGIIYIKNPGAGSVNYCGSVIYKTSSYGMV